MIFTIHWSIYRRDIAQRPAHIRPPYYPTQLKIRVCVYTRFHANCFARLYPCTHKSHTHTHTRTCDDLHTVVDSLTSYSERWCSVGCCSAETPFRGGRPSIAKTNLPENVLDYVEICLPKLVMIIILTKLLLCCIIVGVYATLVVIACKPHYFYICTFLFIYFFMAY